jgi:hypothetical protein
VCAGAELDVEACASCGTADGTATAAAAMLQSWMMLGRGVCGGCGRWRSGGWVCRCRGLSRCQRAHAAPTPAAVYPCRSHGRLACSPCLTCSAEESSPSYSVRSARAAACYSLTVNLAGCSDAAGQTKATHRARVRQPGSCTWRTRRSRPTLTSAPFPGPHPRAFSIISVISVAQRLSVPRLAAAASCISPI